MARWHNRCGGKRCVWEAPRSIELGAKLYILVNSMHPVASTQLFTAYLFFVSVSIARSLSLSLSVCLFVCLYVCLSVSLYLSLSIYLYFYLYLSSLYIYLYIYIYAHPDSNVNGANIGPTWVLSALDGLHAGPMNLAIRDKYGSVVLARHHLQLTNAWLASHTTVITDNSNVPEAMWLLPSCS